MTFYLYKTRVYYVLSYQIWNIKYKIKYCDIYTLIVNVKNINILEMYILDVYRRLIMT